VLLRQLAFFENFPPSLGHPPPPWGRLAAPADPEVAEEEVDLTTLAPAAPHPPAAPDPGGGAGALVDLVDSPAIWPVIWVGGTNVKTEPGAAAAPCDPVLLSPLQLAFIKLEQLERDQAATKEVEAAVDVGMASAERKAAAAASEEETAAEEQVQVTAEAVAAAAEKAAAEEAEAAPAAAANAAAAAVAAAAAAAVFLAAYIDTPVDGVAGDEDEEEVEVLEEVEKPQEEDEAETGLSSLRKRVGDGPAGCSQFKGVSWINSRNTWVAVASNGKPLGHHATEEEAAKAVDDYVNHGTVNHGTVPEFAVRSGRPRGSSQFKGVTWNKAASKWMAMSNRKHLGCHATEEEAARAYDEYVKHGTLPESSGSSRFKGVVWNKSTNKWVAVSKGKHLGSHATEEEAAKAVDYYVQHGIVLESKPKEPNDRGWGASQFKGVSWSKRNALDKKWTAQSPKGKYLGYHATEEAAARAVNDYVKHGIIPKSLCASPFTGVCWVKRNQKWQANCEKRFLGYHVVEEDAARAYNVEAARLGRTLNVIPPAGAAGAGAVLVTGAGAGAGPGAGRKRAAPKTPAAARKNKKMKLADTS